MQSFAPVFQGDLNYDLYNKRQNNRLIKETALGKEQYGENFVQTIKDNKYAMGSQKPGHNQILSIPVKTDSNSLMNDTGIFILYKYRDKSIENEQKTNESIPKQESKSEAKGQEINTSIPTQEAI